MRSLVVVIVGVASVARADDLKPPPIDSEVKVTGLSVTLPPVPVFGVPAVVGDTHDVRELRAHKGALVGSDLKVGGYITWIYDCVTDNLRPGKTRAQVQAAIDDDPTMCERPKFHIGATKDARDEITLWVVDVPRPPNKMEISHLPKDELANRPPVPKLAVGNYVVVSGKFDRTSPHSEQNSDGLLVYRALDHASPPATAPAVVPIPGIKLAQPARPAARATAPILPAKLVEARTKVARGNMELANRRYAEAMAIYREAASDWDGNVLAWYGLGAAAYQLADYDRSVEALERAVALRPDSPVLQVVLGASIYERLVHEARQAQARRDARRPEEVTVDLATINFDRARDHLLLAIDLEPRVWRAHYLLGRILRDGGHPREAAGELGTAIAMNPREAGPYVALVELYRKWDLTDAAVGVARQAVANVDPPGASEANLVLGLALVDKHADAEAIDALSTSIDARSSSQARFQRGQLYVRAKQWAKAKDDLKIVASSRDPRDAFDRAIAQKLLLDLAARH